jgi:UDP-glucose 4-epimerase
VNIFNLGLDEYSEVNHSIRWICEHLGVRPEIRYGGGDRGWVGDSPFIYLNCARMRNLGWTPRLGIRESVIRTVQFLEQNHWVLNARQATPANAG